jgi:PAS domain S-box-containing protein
MMNTAAAVVIIAFGLVWTTTFGLGSFGDPAIPVGERVLAAQTGMVITTLCALVLVALFAERRDNEVALRGSKHRLQLALDGAELGIWEVDPTTGRFSYDGRHSRIHGYPFDGPPSTLAAAQAYVDSRDLPDLEASITAALDSHLGFRAEYRVVPPPGEAKVRHVRWVAAEGAVIRDELGRPARMLGVTRDITASKQAEAALRDSEGRLRDALTAGHVMAFEWDASTRRSQRSANATEILGDEATIGPTSSRTFLTRIHREDRERFKTQVCGVTLDQPFYAVSFRYRRPDGREVWLEETARAEFDGAGRLVSVKGLTRDVTAQHQAEEHQKLLIAELDHRVKNALSRVAAVIRRTRQSSASLDAFVTTLDGRIQSMANAHELLSRSRWQGVRLTDLVERELAPYATADNTVLDGPDVTLTATATQTLAMVLHELTTNAAKYGALSVASGQVSVRWATVPRPEGATVLALDWRESGGPTPTATARPGYGTSVIRQLLPHQLGGAVDLAFATDGVRCRVELPLAPVPATDPSVGVNDKDTSLSEVRC